MEITPRNDPPQPSIRELDAALTTVRSLMNRIDREGHGGMTNMEGGDAGHHASPDLILRHTVNYVLAADLARGVSANGPLLDVGSGVGMFSVWLASRLGRELHLVDHDPTVRQVADASFDDVIVHAAIDDAPSSPVVTAMEVIEHIVPDGQPPFVRALIQRVRPGGLLIVSTPDESGYVGGSSGYAPHVGPLDFMGLKAVLTEATGYPAKVWRIDGPSFELGKMQQLIEPVANRAWALLTRRAPRIANRIASAVGARRRGDATSYKPAPSASEFSVSADNHGSGTGLIAAVYRPVGD